MGAVGQSRRTGRPGSSRIMPMSGKHARIVRSTSAVAAAWGATLGLLTLAAGPLAVLSGNSAIALVQRSLTLLLLPGLIASGAVTGNVHAFSLVIAAAVNALIHFSFAFVVVWFLLAVGRMLRAWPRHQARSHSS